MCQAISWLRLIKPMPPQPLPNMYTPVQNELRTRTYAYVRVRTRTMYVDSTSTSTQFKGFSSRCSIKQIREFSDLYVPSTENDTYAYVRIRRTRTKAFQFCSFVCQFCSIFAAIDFNITGFGCSAFGVPHAASRSGEGVSRESYQMDRVTSRVGGPRSSSSSSSSSGVSRRP